MGVLKDYVLHQFSVAQYDLMTEIGIFAEGPRVELLGGEILEVPRMSVAHAHTLMNLGYMIGHRWPKPLWLAMRIPLHLDDLSEPEPDLMLFRRKRGGHPTAADVLFLIEVSDSTPDYDRKRKFPRYAAASTPEAWLFDVQAGVLERHTEPLAGSYRRLETARAGESLRSTALPDLTLAVDDILAPEDLG